MPNPLSVYIVYAQRVVDGVDVDVDILGVYSGTIDLVEVEQFADSEFERLRTLYGYNFVYEDYKGIRIAFEDENTGLSDIDAFKVMIEKKAVKN